MNEEPNYAEIGRRQAEARKLLGLTQAEMADKIGVPMRTISDNERGVSVAGGRVLAAYCDLGIRSDWLLTGGGKPFSPDAPPYIRDMIEAADDGQIALAHFERTDIRQSYLIGAEERRYLSRISLSRELCAKICGTDDLGLSSAFRLFTMEDDQHGLFIADGGVTTISIDGSYIVLSDTMLCVRRVQPIHDGQLAVMTANDRSKVDAVTNRSDIMSVGIVVGTLCTVGVFDRGH
jgi:transcriptional regulator with XRE-family HTH domain